MPEGALPKESVMNGKAGWFCFVVLLAMTVGFWAGRADVSAQSMDNRSSGWLAGTISYGPEQSAFVLFDTRTRRLMAYSMGPMKRLELLAVREVSWDLKPEEFGKQHPSVQEMRDLFEKSRIVPPKEDKGENRPR